MLQRLNLTNSRSVLFEKTNKHSQMIENMIYLLHEAYYFKWPEYPEITLFYKGNTCVFQINDWFELCQMNCEIAKAYAPHICDWRSVNGQENIGKIIKKILNIPSQYHFNIPLSLPCATKSFVKGYEPTSEEIIRNQLYDNTDHLSFNDQLLHGAGIISRLNDYRTDLLKNLLYKRILARH